MENRAHYVLIGLFTLVVVALLLLFALWLGKIGINQHNHDYRIVFKQAVTGLSKGSQVQYNGIRVGEIRELKLDKKDPRKVLVRIEVDADTPVNTDTVASVGSMGFTGGALVQLSGGTSQSTPLLPSKGDPVPLIKAKKSGMSNLLATAGKIADKMNTIIDRLDQVVSKENIDHINSTLANIDKTTHTLAAERQNMRKLIRQATTASRRLDTALASANQLIDGPARQTLQEARKAMASLDETTRTLNQLLTDNRQSLQAGLQGTDQIGPTLRQMRTTLRRIDELTRKLKTAPAAYLLDRKHPAQFTPGQP